MCTSAVGVSTPSRSKSTASYEVRSGSTSAGTEPPDRVRGRRNVSSPRRGASVVAGRLRGTARPRYGWMKDRRVRRSDRDREGLARDLELLVRGHHEDRHRRGIRRDDPDAAAALLVALLVDL